MCIVYSYIVFCYVIAFNAVVHQVSAFVFFADGNGVILEIY